MELAAEAVELYCWDRLGSGQLASPACFVTSRPPTALRIACEVSGAGPPLVLVHGAGSARWSFDLLRPHLEGRFTVIALDRRGRGDSTDGDEYSLERECDDVAAVVRDAGEGAFLFGHSYGGLVAAGAALRSTSLGSRCTSPRWAACCDRGDDRALGGADPGRRPRHRHARVPAGDRRLRRCGYRASWSARPCGRLAGGSSRRSRASCGPSWRTASTSGALADLDMPCSCWWEARARPGRCAPWRPTRTRSRAPRRACSRATGTART